MGTTLVNWGIVTVAAGRGKDVLMGLLSAVVFFQLISHSATNLTAFLKAQKEGKFKRKSSKYSMQYHMPV